MRVNSSDSETDIDFDWVCSDLSVSYHDVKADIWQKIEEDAVQETTNLTSTIIKFCISAVYWWLKMLWKNFIWWDN